MVPMDQMSIGQEYLGEPKSTSGALDTNMISLQWNEDLLLVFEENGEYTCTTESPLRVCTL